MNDLERKWQADGRGVPFDGARLCLLAFADHLHVFDTSLAGTKSMLLALEAVLAAVGQALQPDKCAWMPVGSVPLTAKIDLGGQELHGACR